MNLENEFRVYLENLWTLSDNFIKDNISSCWRVCRAYGDFTTYTVNEINNIRDDINLAEILNITGNINKGLTRSRRALQHYINFLNN